MRARRQKALDGVSSVPKKDLPPLRDRGVLPGIASDREALSSERSLEIYRLMVRARVMEERMIKMSKSGEGYFWIGGPGEEAFNTCLGLQVKKGQGPLFDYLHLHYRSSATMLALGMDPLDSIRQMAMTKTDPFSLGRNFASHFSRKEWNVVPVSSVIEIQFAMAPGTAVVQKRAGGDGISIVVGGESGSAEGDFTSCMVWSSRPGNELPVLMITMNNGWGISTSQRSQHACEHTVERGRAFGIPGEVVDGNDAVASWFAIERAMTYCRTTRRPFMLEAMVSRLYGHSSSSGAPRHDEPDCVELFEEKLLAAQLIDDEQIEEIEDQARAEINQAVDRAMEEPRPQPQDVETFTYAPSPVDQVYSDDYTGLP